MGESKQDLPPSAGSAEASQLLLTANDIALAATACSLAIAWWRAQPASGYRRAEISKLSDLCSKLQDALNATLPALGLEDCAIDGGDEPLYGPLDASATREPPSESEGR